MEGTTGQQSASESQEHPMMARPQKEHEWLRRLVGEWTYEAKGEMEPGEWAKTSGTESVRSLGDLWFLAEGEGEMPDGTSVRSLMMLGYDPEKQRYLGTWVGSIMTHMFVYEGTLDEAEDTLTLDTEGPSMKGDGSTATYQDIIEFVTDDHRILRSRTPGEDGEWHEFMVANYRRVQ